jgi:hypothetical protein
MASKAKAPAKTPAELVTALLRARELGRRNYAKSDRLLGEIRKQVEVGKEIELPGGKKAVVEDLYATSDKVFRSHGIGRYELKVKDA